MKLTRRKQNDTEAGQASEAMVKPPKAPKPPRARKARKRRENDAAALGGTGKTKGSSKFVLLLGDDGAILVYMQGRTVVRRLFAPSAQPDHLMGITELMRAHPGVPLYILADVLDQQYIRHSFPPVSSMSVGGLVKRRLDRDFQAEDLKGSLPLGRDKGGRKEWNFLLIALANTPALQQWLETLVELPNELKGIYLLPVEAQNYIPALRKALGGETLPWQLLVTHNKVSGFRQVVLRDGKLVFTRVSQAVDDSSAAVIAGNIEQEILNSIEYLRRLGLQENKTLDILVIAAQEVKEALDMNRFGAGQAQGLIPLEVADLLGLEQAALSADRFGDVVVATWFGTAKKRVMRMMTAYAENLAKLYMARRAMMAVAALVLVAGLGLSVMNLLSMLSLNSEAEQIRAGQGSINAQLADEQKKLDMIDKSVVYKAAVVAMQKAYAADAHSPLEFVKDLAPLLGNDIVVTQLNWVPVDANAAQPAPSPGAPSITGPLQIKVTVSMLKKYNDVERLTNAADAFIDTLKEKMPRYGIQVMPYSWLGNSTSLEISLDQKAEPLDVSKERTIDLTFYGPAPETDANAQGQPGGM